MLIVLTVENGYSKKIIESYANYIIHLIISVYNEKYVAGWISARQSVSAMAPLLNYSRTDTQAGTDKWNKGQQYMINTETN